MKIFTILFSLILVSLWTMNVTAADKKVKKKVWVQKMEKKAGLGILVSNVNEDTEKTEGVKEGALIVQVFEESEAEKIGLKKGDVIVEVNNKSVKKPSDLKDALKDAEEGDKVELSVKQDGKLKSFKATLKPFEGGTHPFHIDKADGDIFIDVDQDPGEGKNLEILRSGDCNIPGRDKEGYLGVKVKEISGQLLEYFEVKNGVLIEEVIKDSPAGKAGLMAGDIIISINDRMIEDYQDLIRTVSYYNPEEKVELKFVRKGKNKEIKVVLGNKPAHQWTMKNIKSPEGIHLLYEDEDENVFIDEDDMVRKMRVKGKKAPEEIIEIRKELFIL
jgi:predicted metalloprotease with PDZ domain